MYLFGDFFHECFHEKKYCVVPSIFLDFYTELIFCVRRILEDLDVFQVLKIRVMSC